MRLYHIVAIATGGVIGKDNRLPWHFSCDLKHFKEITMGSTLLMGRKTFESLGKKPLPGRQNFVLSRSSSRGPKAANLKYFDSMEKALRGVKTEKAFIIGGEDLFRQTMERINGIWLTRIEGDYEGDRFYPEIPFGQFEIKTRERPKEDPRLEFIYYERKK